MVDTMVSALRSHCKDWGTQALKLYYGDTYDGRLPDLVVFVDTVAGRKDSCSGKFALYCKDNNTDRLFGERNVWVIVFSTLRLDTAIYTIKKDSTEYLSVDETNKQVGIKKSYSVKKDSETNAIEIRRESLQFGEQPSEKSFVGVLNLAATALVGTALGAQTSNESTQDTVQKPAMKKLGSPGGDSLFFGSAKFNIDINTTNRFVITPKRMLPFRHITYNFVNAEKSWIAAGLGFGYTNTYGLTDPGHINAYLFGHLFLSRPSLPLDSRSYGITVGTNLLKDNLLNDIILGVRVSTSFVLGPLFHNYAGSSGLIIGGNLFMTDGTKVRRAGWFFGLDYKL
jgi:hypothetical protein